jgi:hypothetical protein
MSAVCTMCKCNRCSGAALCCAVLCYAVLRSYETAYPAALLQSIPEGFPAGPTDPRTCF